MNRIESLFSKKANNIKSVYFTAGYPNVQDTETIIDELVKGGIDMIEVGMPFSDPLADGPVIQSSSSQAIKNGMTLKLLLSQISKARETNKDVPLVLMGYLNPIMQYGAEKLFSDAKTNGIDAFIIPDLPYDEYLKEYKYLCDKYALPIIMLITPETSDERIRMIDENCDGFIYMVSAASTTGTRNEFDSEQLAYFNRINSMGLKHERLIGFGISNSKTLNAAYENSKGAIIGSLFIKCLQEEPTIAEAVAKLNKTLSQ